MTTRMGAGGCFMRAELATPIREIRQLHTTPPQQRKVETPGKSSFVQP